MADEKETVCFVQVREFQWEAWCIADKEFRLGLIEISDNDDDVDMFHPHVTIGIHAAELRDIVDFIYEKAKLVRGKDGCK